MNPTIEKLFAESTSDKPWNSLMWHGVLRVRCECPHRHCENPSHLDVHTVFVATLKEKFETRQEFEDHLENATESDFQTLLSAPQTMKDCVAPCLQKELVPTNTLPRVLDTLPPIYVPSIYLVRPTEEGLGMYSTPRLWP